MSHSLGRVLLFSAGLLVASQAHAQSFQPAGSPVLNQARGAEFITPSNTVNITPTRGLHIGDAAACNIAVIFVGNSASVVLPNVQPGLPYPYSIKRLLVTGTSCVSVHALY